MCEGEDVARELTVCDDLLDLVECRDVLATAGELDVGEGEGGEEERRGGLPAGEGGGELEVWAVLQTQGAGQGGRF